MTSSSFKHKLLASAMTLAAMTLGAQAQAQQATTQAPPAAEEPVTVTVVVTRNDAVRAQMRADNAVSVMSADDLEHTAVHNVAEALALLPGISVTNTGNSFFGGVDGASRGEGMFVGVRGMNSEFTLALINGVNAAQGMPYSRQVQLSLLPPSGLKTIVVNKNSTADMDGDAIGGTVDFRTPSAFDFKNGYASVSIAGRVESRARDYDEDGLGGGASGEYARRFGQNDQFGLYISGFYDKRNYANSMVAALMNAQNDGGWAYLHSATNSGEGTNPAGMDKEANLALTGLNTGISTGYTERYGGNFSLDWKVDDSLDLYVRGSYANAETEQNSTLNQFVQNRARVLNTATGLYDLNLTNSSVRMWYTTNPEDADLGTLTFGAVKRAGNWTLSPSVFYSYGSNDRPEHIEASMRNNQTDNYNTGAAAGTTTPYSGLFIGYDSDGYPIPLLTQAQSNLISNANTLLLARRAGQLTEQFSSQAKAGVKFDAQYDFDSGNLSYIKTGFKFVGSHRRVTSRDWTNDHFANLLKKPGVTWAELGLATDYYDSVYPGLYNFRAPKVDHQRLFDLFYQYVDKTAQAADLCYWNCNTLKGDENVTAAYVTGKYDFGNLEVIPGMRYEHTDIENTYWNNDSKAKRFESNSTKYDEWLPSLFVNYRPQGNAVYRASLTRAYMRPALVQLGGNETTERGDNSITVTRGNPDLKTLKSWNLDTSAEWSNTDGGYAMIGAYYKKLSDYMFDNGSTLVNGGTNPAGTTYNGETFDRVTIVAPTNGGDGYVKGLEIQLYQKFAMLPGFLSGFGCWG
ncbi:TonB-dependent receptor [Asticcacaulis sp. SL142]|uniref:TonB-dependent receptor n=1 Tax=Asticcacaulis sp. SL142 TaxID=2995155 RepID=UPI00226C8C6C|nr:TonB-dependent receptor [Asticcacaulis sp. SL142]WAC49177.1 TonB-dependent receptor [Asticcacaulis sp. SL142]